MKTTLSRLPLLTLLVLATMPALGQYKVVGPDGSVTYTDRPPADTALRVTPFGRNAAPPPADSGMPAVLRQPVRRYPVTLYTAENCVPCDNGRRLLQSRGIPYNERRVSSEEDAQALERLMGGRTVPALSVGSQPLRGFAEGDWQAYLDVAGYPKESKLPGNWPVAVPTPLVERVAPPPPQAAVAPPARPSVEPETPTGIRF